MRFVLFLMAQLLLVTAAQAQGVSSKCPDGVVHVPKDLDGRQLKAGFSDLLIPAFTRSMNAALRSNMFEGLGRKLGNRTPIHVTTIEKFPVFLFDPDADQVVTHRLTGYLLICQEGSYGFAVKIEAPSMRDNRGLICDVAAFLDRRDIIDKRRESLTDGETNIYPTVEGIDLSPGMVPFELYVSCGHRWYSNSNATSVYGTVTKFWAETRFTLMMSPSPTTVPRLVKLAEMFSIAE